MASVQNVRVKETEAAFRYCCPECPSYLARLKSTDWAIWAIWSAVSESDWYTASVNNDCYAEAWGVSKERVH